MKVKFKQDYAGRETAMREHKRGEKADLPHQAAIELIDFGIAENKEKDDEVVLEPAPRTMRARRIKA